MWFIKYIWNVCNSSRPWCHGKPSWYIIFCTIYCIKAFRCSIICSYSVTARFYVKSISISLHMKFDISSKYFCFMVTPYISYLYEIVQWIGNLINIINVTIFRSIKCIFCSNNWQWNRFTWISLITNDLNLCHFLTFRYHQ